MRSSPERRACCKRTAANRDKERDDNQRRCKRERGPQTVGYSFGLDKGPIDDVLELLRLQREIVTTVSGFATALGMARASDLIATVPERHTRTLRAGMHSFPLPVSLPEMTISMLWHPRLDADPAHRWLRGCVRDACT